MGQEVARLVHHVDHQVAVVDPDVDVHAEDQHPPGELGQLLDVPGVALADGHLLVEPEEQIKPEFLQSQVEVGSRICQNIQEARAEVVRLRSSVNELAAGGGRSARRR